MLLRQRLIWILLGLAAAAAIGYLLLGTQRAAPNIAWTDLQGKRQDLAALKGNVVLINFWATTCTSCIAEMPKLVKLQESLHGKPYKTVALAMSYDAPAQIRHYVAQTGLPFIVAHDRDGKAAAAFDNVALTPTSFLIDTQGNVVQRYLGEPDMQALEQTILGLL
ncbi:TlpA family protein disulfide reductase [Chitiniphilus purpureus]|uniref:TlpA family protein disulfide reductase n=1 Tax=Chitiniphilus purpureus TaxID=2981137 RepID=A0ABY6DMT1_9NEIS|nr:TlpA disulfide reductase family protein [Chitiniphilus sp. CD1]UXY15646.1 TlpA family protein disulfide reductase [Chitiniphilus sp. CD1]